MNLRIPLVPAAALLTGFLTAPAAHAAPSTTIVISKVMFRGPGGGNDELIELKNKSAAPVARSAPPP